MALHDVWSKFGFNGNPYNQRTLTATADDAKLLAGRDDLLQTAMERIATDSASPTFEGPIGAGKTSLLNVASYKLLQSSLEAKAKELWLPASGTIQIRLDGDEFEAEVYRIILKTLIDHADKFESVGLNAPDLGALEHWLTKPEYKSWQAGGGVAFANASAGAGHEPNTSEGFAKSGLPAAIRQVLMDAYAGGEGGVVCILDNLELAGKVGDATRMLDVLRDRVLGTPGIRWVLCGSRGIVSRARTQRLSGSFMPPTRIPALTEDAAVEAVKLRIERFGSLVAVAPLTPEAFRTLYRILNQNLRETMTWAQNFTFWLRDQFPDNAFPNAEGRTELLMTWLAYEAEKASNTARAQPAAWAFFERICREGQGRAASSEFESKYGFDDQQQGSGYVTVFQKANLIEREIDPEDGRSTINTVTAEGWLVFYHRNGYRIETLATDH
ncbi:hypothetical protein [Frigoribacterium sp. NPDC087798]|uniref:hypothetical protein n=1 Tax=Frigoribacterium sp. NPDC087798 TaxID=3363993 RepID=UPI00380EC575